MLKTALPYVISSPKGILSGREKGAQLLDSLTDHLRSAEPDSVVPLDFSEVEFIDISCADEFLTKLLLRVGSGELGSRFVYVCGANLSVTETLGAVLKLRNLAGIAREGDSVTVLGVLKPPIREALDVILDKGQGTSSEFAEALGKNINIACNRLNVLQRMGLVCRSREGSVPGGGRQFYYESIV